MNESKFTSEWDFMDDDEIRSIQLLFDDSLAAGLDKEDLLKKTAAFELEWQSFFTKAFKRSETDEQYLKRLIKFIRKNLRILDLGGLNAGRSSQYYVFSGANRFLIEKVGELKYIKIVEELEGKI